MKCNGTSFLQVLEPSGKPLSAFEQMQLPEQIQLNLRASMTLLMKLGVGGRQIFSARCGCVSPQNCVGRHSKRLSHRSWTHGLNAWLHAMGTSKRFSSSEARWEVPWFGKVHSILFLLMAGTGNRPFHDEKDRTNCVQPLGVLGKYFFLSELLGALVWSWL